MITINNVSHNINNKTIIHNINLTIAKNSLTALIGANGAGKSTLLSLMARLTPLQCGDINFDGNSLIKTSNGDIAKILAVLTQQSHINARISVHDLLLFGRYPHHLGRVRQVDRDKVIEIMQHFDLTALKSRYLDELSGGQRQRALIAMTFCQETPYILLDEPLNNLDLYYEYKLMQLIRNYVDQKKHTIVVVLHDINQALRYADNVIAMQNGKVAYQGSAEEVIISANIANLFGVNAQIIEHNNNKIVVIE